MIMRNLLSAIFLFASASAFAASPTFQSFNTNDFSTNGNLIALQSAVSNAFVLRQSGSSTNQLLVNSTNTGTLQLAGLTNKKLVSSNVAVMVFSPLGGSGTALDDYTNMTPSFEGQVGLSYFGSKTPFLYFGRSTALKDWTGSFNFVEPGIMGDETHMTATNPAAEWIFRVNGNIYNQTNGQGVGTNADNVIRVQNESPTHYSAIAFNDHAGQEQGAIGWGNTNTAIYSTANYWESFGTASPLYFAGSGFVMGGMEKTTGDFVYYPASTTYSNNTASALPFMRLARSSGAATFRGPVFITNTTDFRVGNGSDTGTGRALFNPDGSFNALSINNFAGATSLSQRLFATNFLAHQAVATFSGTTAVGNPAFSDVPSGIQLFDHAFGGVFAIGNVSYFRWGWNSGTVEFNAQVNPWTDDTQALGNSGLRWHQANVVNLTNVLTYSPTNVAPFGIILTNNYVIGTRYTNTAAGGRSTQRAWVSASFQLTAAAAGTAQVTLYVETTGVRTNRLTCAAGPLAGMTTVEPLGLPVGPSSIFYFLDETSGVGASAAIVTLTSTYEGM